MYTDAHGEREQNSGVLSLRGDKWVFDLSCADALLHPFFFFFSTQRGQRMRTHYYKKQKHE